MFGDGSENHYPGSEVPLQRKRRKGTSDRTQQGFSNDQTNQIIAFHWWNLRLIGRSYWQVR